MTEEIQTLEAEQEQAVEEPVVETQEEQPTQACTKKEDPNAAFKDANATEATAPVDPANDPNAAFK